MHAKNIHDWFIYLLLTLQSFLAIEDIGDSLDSAETLINKHKNFEKSLIAQEEKFKVSIMQLKNI